MDGSTTTLSLSLLAANRRLLELRARPVGVRCSDNELNGECRLPVAELPAHLGWGSAALTAVLRRRQQEADCEHEEDSRLVRPATTAVSDPIPTPNTADPVVNQSSSSADWVKLYPDIGLGMLRQGLTAPGRLWLLLRYLDKMGSGKLRIDVVRRQLTDKTSTLRLCGKRQWRNLLRDGEGGYWRRDKEHIWLRSAAKVAYTLGVEKLTGRPVALPLTALLDGIGTFRAHLYTAFHSGRTKERAGGQQAAPIARQTLARLSGVGRSSQQAYEAQVGVQVQTNFAIGACATKENEEKRAWQQGQALFALKDYRGQQGKKGKRYLAWQLPNSYGGQHRQRPKGRQRRINDELKDLVKKGAPGNVEAVSEKPEQVYFPNGKLAARANGRHPAHDVYWQRGGGRNGRCLWQSLGQV